MMYSLADVVHRIIGNIFDMQLDLDPIIQRAKST